MARPDPAQGPSGLLWLIAVVGLALPWVAALLGGVGVYRIVTGADGGWPLVLAAATLFAADVALDFWMARAPYSQSDEPRLNARGAALVGRELIVAQAIEGGRGKVRVADTLWSVEGSDVPAGTRVRVIGVSGTVLRVERIC